MNKWILMNNIAARHNDACTYVVPIMQPIIVICLSMIQDTTPRESCPQLPDFGSEINSAPKTDERDGDPRSPQG